MDRFYITTPIYYVNARPHLGHAYTTIVADTLARFHRAMGRDVFFLTGTDEHGDKIVQAAEQAGMTPREYAGQISRAFREQWVEMGLSFDDFIRTTEERHVRVVQDILQRVHDNGDIYFAEYEGLYCYGCERFLTEKELVEGSCPDHGKPPARITEANYFFRMSAYRDWLLDHLEKNPDFIRPERYRNEVVSLLRSGELEDLCISRPKTRLTWGIELPFDDRYVTYVWFDALINYVSALGYPDGEPFRSFWPVAQHLVAKDILKPHAIFWPTMLKAAGIPLYRHLNVHGYWLIKDMKMSKSIGNVVKPLEMAEKYGMDTFRYFLLREMTFGNDASFTEEALVGRRNADLANDLGNLLNRTLAMTHKYFAGLVPDPGRDRQQPGPLGDLVRTALADFQQGFAGVRFSRALESLWEAIRGLNRYIDSEQPWALHKQGEEAQLATVMYNVLESLRKIARHLVPVMPHAAAGMLGQLGLGDSRRTLSEELDHWGGLEPGTGVSRSSNLFPRLEPEKDPSPCPPQKDVAAPEESLAEFSDFQKLDLRIGTILSARTVPRADKLLQLMVDLGETEPRQLVAGVAEHYSPDDLPGRQVVVVANLKPRTIRGVRSQGMVLAVHEKGALRLVVPSQEVTPGSRVS